MKKEDKEALKSIGLLIFILGVIFSVPYMVNVMDELPTSILLIIVMMIILTRWCLKVDNLGININKKNKRSDVYV